MTLEELKTYIHKLLDRLEPGRKDLIEARLEGLISVFPFNEYEYLLTFLVGKKTITFDEYEKLRKRYVDTNRYLDLFNLAPRIFGEVWGEQHLEDIDHRFKKPCKALDPEYDGQYDLWLEGKRVEVKSSRATHTKKRDSMASKALCYASDDPFWMNFQQIKLDTCDAFVFIGVWVDQIIYWVLSNKEAASNSNLSHQHRGGIEYQIGITDKNLREFDRYKVEAKELVDAILGKGV